MIAWRRFLSTETSLFLVYFGVALVGLRGMAFSDPGSLWHIRVGELILRDGAIMQTDPFSFTFANHPWRPQQWGAEVGMAWLHRAGGLDALLLTMAVLLAAFATWVTGRFVAGGLHPLPAAAVVLFGLVAAAFHFYARPHLATILLMGLVMGFVIDFERGRFGWRRWLWLVPVFVVWTNLHGGVLGGIATVGLALGGWTMFFSLKLHGPIHSWRTVWILGGIGALYLLSPLVNPYGVGMIRIWNSIVGSKLLPQIVSEHAPLRLTDANGFAVAGFGAFYLLALAGTLPKAPHVSWLLPLGWLAFSFQSIRHGPLFCAAALVALADLLPHTVWFRQLRKHGDTFVRPVQPLPKARQLPWLIPIIVVVMCAFLPNKVRLDPRDVPVDLLEPVRDFAAGKPVGTPIFNDANFGGFLIYFEPRLRVYMDDRCELYGESFMQDYIDMMREYPERIEQVQARYGFKGALAARDSPMDKYLQSAPNWRETARASAAVLYERR